MRGENTLPHCLTRVAAAGGADVVLTAGHAARADFCRVGNWACHCQPLQPRGHRTVRLSVTVDWMRAGAG